MKRFGAALLLLALTGCSAPARTVETPGAVHQPSASPVALDTATVDPIVGAWRVTVTGAPYAPHLFSFLPGGVMLSANPSDVQSAGKDGTTDSLGMGTWAPVQGKPGTYAGTFWELNAKVSNRTPTDSLVVTYVIEINGDKLTGQAQAGLSSDLSKLRPASFAGARITTNLTMLALVATK